LLRLVGAGAGEVVVSVLAGRRGFGCWHFTVFSGRSDAAPPVLVEHEHGGASLEPGVASLARPVSVTRFAQRDISISVVLAQRMFLASGHVLGPVAGVSLLVVEEAADAELLSGRPVPAGPVPGAGRLVPEDAVQPVAVLRALGGIGEILVFTYVRVSPGIVTTVCDALIFSHPN